MTQKIPSTSYVPQENTRGLSTPFNSFSNEILECFSKYLDLISLANFHLTDRSCRFSRKYTLLDLFLSQQRETTIFKTFNAIIYNKEDLKSTCIAAVLNNKEFIYNQSKFDAVRQEALKFKDAPILSLDYAADNGSTEVLEATFYHPKFKGIGVDAALLKAAENGHDQVVHIIIDTFSREIPHQRLGKALIRGAQKGYIKVVKELIGDHKLKPIESEDQLFSAIVLTVDRKIIRLITTSDLSKYRMKTLNIGYLLFYLDLAKKNKNEVAIQVIMDYLLLSDRMPNNLITVHSNLGNALHRAVRDLHLSILIDFIDSDKFIEVSAEKLNDSFATAIEENRQQVVSSFVKRRLKEISLNNIKKAFFWSAEKGHEQIFRKIIESSQFGDTKVEDWDRAFEIASHHKQKFIILNFKDSSTKFGLRYTDLILELFDAIYSCNEQKAEQIINHEKFNQLPIKDLNKAFKLFAGNGNAKILESFLKKIDVSLSALESALLSAAYHGYTEAAKVIIQHSKCKEIDKYEIGKIIRCADEKKHEPIADMILDALKLSRESIWRRKPSYAEQIEHKPVIITISKTLNLPKPINDQNWDPDKPGYQYLTGSFFCSAAENEDIENLNRFIQSKHFDKMDPDYLGEGLCSLTKNRGYPSGVTDIVLAITKNLQFKEIEPKYIGRTLYSVILNSDKVSASALIKSSQFKNIEASDLGGILVSAFAHRFDEQFIETIVNHSKFTKISPNYVGNALYGASQTTYKKIQKSLIEHPDFQYVPTSTLGHILAMALQKGHEEIVTAVVNHNRLNNAEKVDIINTTLKATEDQNIKTIAQEALKKISLLKS